MGFLASVKEALKGAVTSQASTNEVDATQDVVSDRSQATPVPPTSPADPGVPDLASEAVEDARAATEATFEIYTVATGDSLPEIGARFGVSVQEIARLNNIENPDLIFPGQVFRIPTN